MRLWLSIFAKAMGLLLIWTLGACDSDNFVQATPTMEVGQKRIEFGAVPVGGMAERSLVIQNRGRNTLNLDPAFEGPDAAAFSFGDFDASIPPGEQGLVTVRFAPDAVRRYDSILALEGNDPDHPRVEVKVGGEGYRQGILEVTPAELDFGLVAAGKVGIEQVVIHNAGNGDLIVSRIGFSDETSPDFQILNSTSTPAAIPADGTIMLNLAYRPGLGSTPPAPGLLIVEASDPVNPSDEVLLRAALNRAPLADAGPDQEVDPLSPVLLNGENSSDPDGDEPLSFDWSLVRRPEGSSAQLVAKDQAQVTFVPDLVGIYEAQLFVTDCTGLRSLLPDRVAVLALPAEQLLVELVWDSPLADLDLHMVAPGGQMGGALDCHYDNPNPDWGLPGVVEDDPKLLRDDLAGFGPETIGYAQPIDGNYQLVVDYYAAHTPSGNEATTVTLRVFVDGILAAEVVRRLESQGQRWVAVGVQWPEGTVYAIDNL
ncbi:MAG: choice-of-anchor D domain-containing protein [Deltaproteobacteria bacterium]|nr:choice-of-anchor D domain-containing protein [Deltaproteobacteria bacterium]